MRNNTSFRLEESEVRMGVVGVLRKGGEQEDWSGWMEPETGCVTARAIFPF